MTDPRYPIGKFVLDGQITQELRQQWIEGIAQAPALLRAAVAGLSPRQLDTPYRHGGWTVRQVVHHLPDSHMNAYIRFRMALTEEFPTIKPYNEVAWAELQDARNAPIEVSLDLLDALHARWVLLLRSISPPDWTRKYHHPECGAQTLMQALGSYAWHCRHHTAHIGLVRPAAHS